MNDLMGNCAGHFRRPALVCDLFKTAILLVPNQCDAEEVQELAQQNGACNVLCIFSSSKCVNICDMTLRTLRSNMICNSTLRVLWNNFISLPLDMF